MKGPGHRRECGDTDSMTQTALKLIKWARWLCSFEVNWADYRVNLVCYAKTIINGKIIKYSIFKKRIDPFWSKSHRCNFLLSELIGVAPARSNLLNVKNSHSHTRVQDRVFYPRKNKC